MRTESGSKTGRSLGSTATPPQGQKDNEMSSPCYGDWREAHILGTRQTSPSSPLTNATKTDE